MDYKADITLNERDSLTDMLLSEKNLLRDYIEAASNSCSKGFIELVRENLGETLVGQKEVYFMLTSRGYAGVTSASAEDLKSVKETFTRIKNQLS